VTEFAAPATPVLLGLLLGTLIRCEAETVERLTADLAEYHLMEIRDIVRKKTKNDQHWKAFTWTN